MLIITELAEAIEADRHDRRADQDAYLQSLQVTEYPRTLFEDMIKDTVEDELADAYIRCLDYLYYRHREYITIHGYTIKFSDNFAENVFGICKTVTDRQIKDTVVHIEEFCKHESIDLQWHVAQKMNYNDSRAYKHGGKKY